jgi:hypothetical protein
VADGGSERGSVSYESGDEAGLDPQQPHDGDDGAAGARCRAVEYPPSSRASACFSEGDWSKWCGTGPTPPDSRPRTAISLSASRGGADDDDGAADDDDDDDDGGRRDRGALRPAGGARASWVSHTDPLVSHTDPLVSHTDPLVSHTDPLVSQPQSSGGGSLAASARMDEPAGEADGVNDGTVLSDVESVADAEDAFDADVEAARGAALAAAARASEAAASGGRRGSGSGRSLRRSRPGSGAKQRRPLALDDSYDDDAVLIGSRLQTPCVANAAAAAAPSSRGAKEARGAAGSTSPGRLPPAQRDIFSPLVIPLSVSRGQAGFELSPRPADAVQLAAIGAAHADGRADEDDVVDLLYDPTLNCYYEPRTGKYYELSI